jgi:DNA-binding beta-propeller fold protein YncE
MHLYLREYRKLILLLFVIALWIATPAIAQTTPPTVTATFVTYPTKGAPFKALPTSSGTVLVSLTANATKGSVTGMQVFTPTAGGGLQSKCALQLRAALLNEGAAFADMSLYPNGTGVAGAIGSPGAIFYNLADLESCSVTGFVVGQGPIAADEGTFDVVITPDGKYAFVANEYGVAPGATTEGNIGVVALQYDANGNVTTGTTLLGQISTGGRAVPGMTLSPDGTRLYVTSEIAVAGTSAFGGDNPVLARTGCVQQPGSSSINGLLSVIDVAAAEASPGTGAILVTVDAGCSPVRMAETADNSTLWVTARGDNRVLAFSTALLESNPDNALLGFADTGGTAPVGLHLFHNDQLLAVANSNRFDTGTANATILYVANPAAASVVTTIPSGLFPREFSVGPDGSTLYLTNYQSSTLEVISTTVN